MDVYLINLDRRGDRLQAIQKTFDRIGLSFIRIAAVDGMLMSQDERDWGYSLTPGEIGCYLSHKKCIELIAASQNEYGVVLEDDVQFSDGVERYLTDMNWIPKGADIVKLDTCGHLVHIKHLVELPDARIRLGRLLSPHVGAAAYIMSREAAKKLLSLLDDMNIPIDRLLFTHDRGVLNNMTVCQVIPALCQQSGSPSTINLDRDIWMQKQVKSARPKLMQRMLREVKRPFKAALYNTISGFSRLYRRVRMGKHWIRVPFG